MNLAIEEKPMKTISVYYDGLCHLCSREINHYKTLQGSEKVDFVDITDPLFQAQQWGLDPVKVHQSLHVRDRSGSFQTGVDAFICIWQELSALRFLASIARVKPIYSVMKILYFVFAKVRPLLPRKSCETSPYCEAPKK